MDDKLDKLRQAVRRYDADSAKVALSQALESGVSCDTLRHEFLLALEDVRHHLMSNEASVPEFLLCLDVVLEGLASLAAHSGGVAGGDTALVIGVVEGDPHDLGKNIVAGVYRAAGYAVTDLGCFVTARGFARAVAGSGAEILALSAMMSTTMPFMKDAVLAAREASPGIVVMAGGAALDACVALSYGADGYAESALTVLEETEAAVNRAREGRGWSL